MVFVLHEPLSVSLLFFYSFSESQQVNTNEIIDFLSVAFAESFLSHVHDNILESHGFVVAADVVVERLSESLHIAQKTAGNHVLS